MPKRTKAPSQRQLKAGEVIRKALVKILAHEQLRDTDLQGVSITISEVSASPDMHNATVFAAPLGGKDTDKVIKALNRASKFLRGRLGRELTMRTTPNLCFEADTTFETAAAMNELMARPEIARDLKKFDLEESEDALASEDKSTR
ncbi:MAG: ribosome-binding factor A [Robiginitomaculum sp.]|nr:MAG: ribosome-binding factor A [Robiginitomaculum sp.]